jgi:hypothetical protein
MKGTNIVMMLLSLTLFNCQNSKKNMREESFNQPGNAPYIIKEVHPNAAIPGTKITISGSNFPEKGLEVYFDDVFVDSLESVSALSVSVIVPRVKNEGKVKLQLRTKGQEFQSNSIPFTVEPVPADVPAVYFTTHKLFKGSISNHGLLEIEELDDIGFPRGLHVDKKNDEIIYASYFGHVYRRVGNAQPVLIKKFPEGLECMVLDSRKEWMYVATESTISRMLLTDTSHVEILFKGRQRPKDIHINEKTNELVWSEADPLLIVAAGVDGKTDPKVIFDKDSGLTGPTCLEIDVENQKIYVGDVTLFGSSRIMEGDLQNPGVLKVLYKTVDGIGENVINLKYDNQKYLYVMNSKGVNQDIPEDGGIVRISVKEQGYKPEVIMQPIHHGYLIGL